MWNQGDVVSDQPFTHIDASGKLRMVDVSRKRRTRRSASARCTVVSSANLSELGNDSSENEAIHVARLAGILAAKQTATLIPLCHPLNLHDIHVEVTTTATGIEIQSQVLTIHHTGVEMEALTACAVTALSLVTTLLHMDPSARIEDLALVRKTGGQSGDWGRAMTPNPE